MRLFSSIISLIIISLSLNAQDAECSLFDLATNSKVFKLEFNTNKFDSLIIYDKVGILQTCSSTSEYLKISTDSKYDLTPESRNASASDNLIIFFKYERTNKKRTLYFWKPSTGAAINLTYKDRKNSHKHIKTSIGTF
jgi:hypothetical protein